MNSFSMSMLALLKMWYINSSCRYSVLFLIHAVLMGSLLATIYSLVAMSRFLYLGAHRLYNIRYANNDFSILVFFLLYDSSDVIL